MTRADRDCLLKSSGRGETPERTEKDMQVYERTENGILTMVDQKAGLDEINAAMMGVGRKAVRSMSSITRTDYAIEYKDGRSVRLALVDVPEAGVENSSLWTVASHRTLLHRFTEATKDGRAVCNKSFRPYRYGNGYDFKTRADHEASKYAYLYTFCPRCESK